MGGLDRDREDHRSRADVPPSKKEACRRPAIRLISKKIGCCLPPKGFPLKRTRHKRCAMRFPQKVCKIDDVQLAPLKMEELSTACNGLPPKSKHRRRVATAFRNEGEMDCPPSPRLAKDHLAGASTTVWQVAREAFGRWRTMRCAALFMTHAQTRSIHAEAEARVGWAPSRARS